jgi:hypothetical protein
VKDGQYLGDLDDLHNDFGQAIRLAAALTREDANGILYRVEQVKDRGERQGPVERFG